MYDVLLVYHTYVFGTFAANCHIIKHRLLEFSQHTCDLDYFNIKNKALTNTRPLNGLSDFVETHLTQAAQKQKTTYDHKATQQSFTVGEQVWLASPTAGKLDPKWEGEWEYNQYRGQQPTLSLMKTELRAYT